MLINRRQRYTVHHAVAGTPRHAAAETFVSNVFREHYQAAPQNFTPNFIMLERNEELLAAAGWRCAADDRLFLESYLDRPVETLVSGLAGRPVSRERIVEVGHLAVTRRGGSVDVILTLAAHLDRLGYEWVVFTATQELIGIFRRLQLPPLALATADPDRLGPQADDWGSYYASRPVVVAGRIRLALDKAHSGG